MWVMKWHFSVCIFSFLNHVRDSLIIRSFCYGWWSVDLSLVLEESSLQFSALQGHRSRLWICWRHSQLNEHQRPLVCLEGGVVSQFQTAWSILEALWPVRRCFCVKKRGAGRRQTLWAVVLCLFQDPNTALVALSVFEGCLHWLSLIFHSFIWSNLHLTSI